MKIRKFFAFFAVVIAAVMFAACSDANSEQKAADEALHQKLIGAWVYLDSIEKDENGNVVKYEVYQFDEKVSKYHEVTGIQVMSGAIDLYEIENGCYTTDLDGVKQYAKLEIEEQNGREHLHWILDSGTLEFIKLTDEEIEENSIPVTRVVAGEAELLGIEEPEENTDNSQSAETSASE